MPHLPITRIGRASTKRIMQGRY